MKHKLSTDAALPGGELKKGEAKKRKSPLTPYREKAKGKETNPVLVAQVYRARTRGEGSKWAQRTFYYALKKSKKLLMPVNTGRNCVQREEERPAD